MQLQWMLIAVLTMEHNGLSSADETAHVTKHEESWVTAVSVAFIICQIVPAIGKIAISRKETYFGSSFVL